MAALLSSLSDCTALERARFRGGESRTGEDARLAVRPVVLAGFAGFAGAGLVAPLVVGRGAALAWAVAPGPTEDARVDRRRGGWVDMTEMLQRTRLGWSSTNHVIISRLWRGQWTQPHTACSVPTTPLRVHEFQESGACVQSKSTTAPI